jgi:histidinol-phosphate aminotransferase
MAGARLGYCVAPSWIIEEFDKVVLPYHVDAIKQVAGRLALDFVPEMDERVDRISSERNKIEKALRELGLVVWPSEANFVLFRSTNPVFPGNLIWEHLLDRSILVRNCSSWPLLEGCLRVTVGNPNENDRFIGALQEIIA